MQATTANEWLKPYIEGTTIKLPSGNVIKMRPVALDELMRNGSIPDFLSPVASTTLWEGINPDDINKDGFKIINQMSELASIILPNILIEPKIYTGDGTLPEGMIKLEHISVSDKMAIFNLAIQPVNALEAFRKEQERDVENLSDDKGSSL